MHNENNFDCLESHTQLLSVGPMKGCGSWEIFMCHMNA
jgi:hypothetical protein